MISGGFWRFSGIKAQDCIRTMVVPSDADLLN